MKSALLADNPSPHDALAWLNGPPVGGALAFVVTSAKGTGLRSDPAPDAERLLEEAAERALAASGASRVLVWHARGVVPLGAPVAIVGASAEHRKDALRAVDVLLAGLKGVAERTDLPTPS